MIAIIPLVLILCLLAPIAYLYLNQRSMIYYPRALDRRGSQVAAYQSSEITISNQGLRLHGWLLNRGESRLIIYYGGNGEELSQCIDLFEPFEQSAALLLNYRGYGESEGKPTEKGLIEDALAAFDQLRDRYPTIVLMGRSLGSGIAVQVAGRRPVSGLILITPYDSIASIARRRYPLLPVSWFLKDRFDSVAAAAAVTVPALFLIAEKDEIIPVSHSRKLAEMWKSDQQWKVIRDATHNTISGYPEFGDAISRFLRKVYLIHPGG